MFTTRLTDRRTLLGAIVLLGVVTRLAGIGDRLSDAEGYSWLVASAPDAGTLFDRLVAYENTPPLFYALMAGLPLDDEAWLRVWAALPAVASLGVLYCVARPILGTPVALLSALLLAVAPYHVSYSNYSRGFMLAGFGLLLATWAVARLLEGRPGRWWGLYVAGAVLALHAEYYAALYLAPLVLVLVLSQRRSALAALALGAVPLLSLVPLIGLFMRSQEAVGQTKFSPVFPGPSATSLRDTVTTLAVGEHGATGGAIAWLELGLLAGALAIAIACLARGTSALGKLPPDPRREALLLFAAVPAAALALHALVAIVGPDIFNQRYLTGLVPMAAVLLSAGAAAVPRRVAMPMVAVAAVGLGCAVVGQRTGRELEPDYRSAAAAVRQAGARSVLTNSAAVAYYLRDLPVRVDRPFGSGRGREARCPSECALPYAVVDDSRSGTGARPGPGPVEAVGPLVVRLPGLLGR